MLDHLHLLRRPLVQVHRFYFSDVDAQLSVHSRAPDADEHAEGDRRPPRDPVVTVGAREVVWSL